MQICAKRMAALREHVRAESEHDMDTLIAGMTQDCFNDVAGVDKPFVGPEQTAERYRKHWEGFPDFTVRVRRILCVYEGSVVTENEWRGTHLGTFLGWPATGKPVRYHPACLRNCRMPLSSPKDSQSMRAWVRMTAMTSPSAGGRRKSCCAEKLGGSQFDSESRPSANRAGMSGERAGCDRQVEAIANQSSTERRGLAVGAAVEAALRQDRLLFAFQPVVCAATGKVDYFECLLRMRDEEGGIVSGGEFITIVEELGWIGLIDRYVLEKTVQALAVDPEVRLGFNISGMTAGDRPWLRSLTHSPVEVIHSPGDCWLSDRLQLRGPDGRTP